MTVVWWTAEYYNLETDPQTKDLFTLAAVYNAAKAGNKGGTKAIADYMGISTATADRWLKQARTQHLTGPNTHNWPRSAFPTR